MLIGKFCERSKKSIWIFFLIYSVKNFVFGQTIFFQKCFVHFFGEFVIQKRLHKFQSDMRSASFIAKNVSEPAFHLSNFLSIVVTGIRTCAENAGNAFLVSQQRARRSKYVVIDFCF